MPWIDPTVEPADVFVNDDADAGVLNADIDYDGMGGYKRRFDEPDADLTEVSNPTTIWSVP
jgi:hypothetical protein